MTREGDTGSLVGNVVTAAAIVLLPTWLPAVPRLGAWIERAAGAPAVWVLAGGILVLAGVAQMREAVAP